MAVYDGIPKNVILMRKACDRTITDKERLTWLEDNEAFSLINDDNGHWACVSDGIQNVPMDDETCDIQTTFFIEKDRWKGSIREAIDYAIEQYGIYGEEI